MDVKDFTTTEVTTSPSAIAPQQRSLAAIPSIKATPATDEPVTVSINSQSVEDIKPSLRTELNRVINIINVTNAASSSISSLVGSLEGIVTQAGGDNTSSNRIAALEREANALVDEVKRRADDANVNGLKPLAGDRVVLEYQKQIGRQLDIIFPDNAKNAFGLGNIKFDTKESIIANKVKLETAWRQVQELTKAVDTNTSVLKDTAVQLDVAIQNSRSAESRPQDLEAALALTEGTIREISKDPASAINSIGQPNQIGELLK